MGDCIDAMTLSIEDDIKIEIDDTVYIKDYTFSNRTLVCG